LKLLDFAPWRLGLYCTPESVGTRAGFYLSSHFQAIFSAEQRRPVAYEALIRATSADGLSIAPPQLFESVPAGEARTMFDRQCRSLQVEKFIGLGDARSWLFLNLDPYVAVDSRRFGPLFAQMLESHGFPANRVAVELTESPLLDEERLASAVDYYRELGCHIVVDDFGAGHSNFDRIWRLKPHVVKIDREMTRRVTTEPVARRMFAGIVSVLHDAGALVCVEGIETEDQALCAAEANADLLQGYYFARPAETLVAEDVCRDVFDHLREVSAQRRPNEAADATSGSTPMTRVRKPFWHCRMAWNTGRRRRDSVNLTPTYKEKPGTSGRLSLMKRSFH
jgi:EAL domain-containing protein (putative c-di-GMP-specific phosphodiesterase class I)